ncbi:hypothetical protein J6600_19285 [Bacillus sp. LJBV19]|uniref:hypothetical protein n=1 Tax=Bacillus sp. LJBV19 TaxID=2821409 RepID=UPI001AE05582|nr:hypothetical protein [Bacillus sp. LJBV19]QTN95745.1 hypothetical protein J6600_19285 [Bacillus sp. LJBV19]
MIIYVSGKLSIPFDQFQRYEDFVARIPTIEEKLKQNSIKSTLPDAAPTNLHWVLPQYVTEAVEEFLNHLSLLSEDLINGDTLLHAPVWELCWDRVQAEEGLRTNVPGFYVAGDAIGWARGIIQAATTGIVIARVILNGKKPSDKELTSTV